MDMKNEQIDYLLIIIPRNSSRPSSTQAKSKHSNLSVKSGSKSQRSDDLHVTLKNKIIDNNFEIFFV